MSRCLIYSLESIRSKVSRSLVTIWMGGAVRPIASEHRITSGRRNEQWIHRPCELLALKNLAVHDAHLHFPMSDPVRGRVLLGHPVRQAGVGARVLRTCDGVSIAIQKLREELDRNDWQNAPQNRARQSPITDVRSGKLNLYGQIRVVRGGEGHPRLDMSG